MHVSFLAFRNIEKCSDCGAEGRFVLNGRNCRRHYVIQSKWRNKLYSNISLHNLIFTAFSNPRVPGRPKKQSTKHFLLPQWNVGTLLASKQRTRDSWLATPGSRNRMKRCTRRPKPSLPRLMNAWNSDGSHSAIQVQAHWQELLLMTLNSQRKRLPWRWQYRVTSAAANATTKP